MTKPWQKVFRTFISFGGTAEATVRIEMSSKQALGWTRALDQGCADQVGRHS